MYRRSITLNDRGSAGYAVTCSLDGASGCVSAEVILISLAERWEGYPSKFWYMSIILLDLSKLAKK